MLAPCSVGGSQRLPVAAAVAPLVSRQRPRQHRHSRPPHDFTAHANAGISGGNSRPRSDCTCRASASDSPPPMGKPGRRGYRYVWHSTDEDWNSPFLAPGERPLPLLPSPAPLARTPELGTSHATALRHTTGRTILPTRRPIACLAGTEMREPAGGCLRWLQRSARRRP